MLREMFYCTAWLRVIENMIVFPQADLLCDFSSWIKENAHEIENVFIFNSDTIIWQVCNTFLIKSLCLKYAYSNISVQV